MTDVIIQHLVTNQKVRIKCKDLVSSDSKLYTCRVKYKLEIFLTDDSFRFAESPCIETDSQYSYRKG